ncbi:MFS transporter, partial [Streptomyces zhihengii]
RSPAAARDPARETLGGAAAVAGRLPEATGGALLDAAQRAFVQGMGTAAIGGGAVLVGAAVLAAVVLRRTERPADRAAGEPEAAVTAGR